MKIKLRCPKGHGKTVGMESAGTDVKCDECDHVWRIPPAPTTGPEGEIMALTQKLARTEAELEKARASLLAKDAEIDGLRKDLAALRAKHRPEGGVMKTSILPTARADFLHEAAAAAPKDGPAAKPPEPAKAEAPKPEPAKAEAAGAAPAKAEAAKPEEGPPNLAALRENAKRLGRPEGVKTTLRLGDEQKAALLAALGVTGAEAPAPAKDAGEAKDAPPPAKADAAKADAAKAEPAKAEPAKPEEGPPDLNALRERAKKQARGEGVQRTVLLEPGAVAALLAKEETAAAAAGETTAAAGKPDAAAEKSETRKA